MLTFSTNTSEQLKNKHPHRGKKESGSLMKDGVVLRGNKLDATVKT
jgi:hypothetical protein